MSIMSRPVTGAELANELAEKLSDLEFELLVRERIKRVIARCHAANPNLSESHDRVAFRYDGRDSSLWTFSLGETYSKCKEATGEVLNATAADAQRMMEMFATNKMSLLLAAPAECHTMGSMATDDRNIPF